MKVMHLLLMIKLRLIKGQSHVQGCLFVVGTGIKFEDLLEGLLMLCGLEFVSIGSDVKVDRTDQFFISFSSSQDFKDLQGGL